jgi:hypothetical protein
MSDLIESVPGTDYLVDGKSDSKLDFTQQEPSFH